MKEFPKFTFKGAPMTDKQSELFISLLMNKGSEIDVRDSRSEDLKKAFPVQVLLTRVEVYKLPFVFTDMFILTCMSMDIMQTPGKVMLLLRLCYQTWKEIGFTVFNVEVFAKMFPWGVPTEQEWKSMWDSQKCDRNENVTDNLVDDVKYWQ